MDPDDGVWLAGSRKRDDIALEELEFSGRL